MTVQTQTFDQLVTTEVTAMQASAAKASPPRLLDFSIGSVLRAVAEAVASAIGLFLQGVALQILALTRLATSNGTDADSWVADFGFTRLPGVAASGSVTFSRFTTTLQAILPVGAQVQTSDGTQQYVVLADTTNSAFNASLNAFVIAAGVPNLVVTVRAVNAVAATNALAGTISQMTSPISGIDTVTNGANFTNGADPETDAAMRVRFVAFIASLSKATKAAIGAAILNVQQNLTYTLTENADYPGTPADNGNFFVIVDDGTGSPGSTLLATVNNAVDAVRPLTSRFTVNAPTKVIPAIVLNIRVAAGFVSGNVQTAVAAAVAAAVNALPLGTPTLFISAIEAAALAVAGCSAVQPTHTTINAGSTDLALSAIQVPRITAGNVTVGTY